MSEPILRRERWHAMVLFLRKRRNRSGQRGWICSNRRNQFSSGFRRLARGDVDMSIWGHTADGTAVPIFALTSGPIEVRLTAYGARVVSIRTPDRNGKLADIVLGFDKLD